MKVSFFAVAALWAGTALAQAPDAPPGGPGPGAHHESAAARMDHLATLLDLSADQKTQVQAVLDKEHAQMKAAHEQMKAAHDQMQQDTLAKLKPILTADQLEKFQVLMAERGPPGRPH